MDGERLTFGDVNILIRVSTPDMCVLEGDHVVEIGAEEHRIGPGESVFAPRGVPHSQRRVVPGEGRLLVVTAPGGLDGFFRELAAADTAGTLGPEAYATASERYGIAWL